MTKKPLLHNEALRERVETDLAEIKGNPKLVRSFFKAKSVAYIKDWVVGLPIVGISPEDAVEHFGLFAGAAPAGLADLHDARYYRR